jgi:hypothetical protein
MCMGKVSLVSKVGVGKRLWCAFLLSRHLTSLTRRWLPAAANSGHVPTLWRCICRRAVHSRVHNQTCSVNTQVQSWKCSSWYCERLRAAF